MDDVRRLDAVQDHVHDAHDVGEALLLLAKEGSFLKRLAGLRRVGLRQQVFEGLAEEARRAAGAIIDALADLRVDHLDHGADQRPRRVVFAAVAAGIAHAPDLVLVERGQFVLFLLRAEAELVDQFQRIAQRIAAVEPVFDLAENLADLVFDGVGVIGARSNPIR